MMKSDSQLVKLGAKVLSADSQDAGNPASQAIDGDASTIWHTRWRPKEDLMPHQFVIDLGKEVALKGITYLPRQDMVNGRIAAYEIYVGNDEKNSGEAAAIGTWKNSAERQTVQFNRPVKGRYLNVVPMSEVQGKPYAAIAEVDVIMDKTY